jgi:ribosomal-protein-serine acetyltransferase
MLRHEIADHVELRLLQLHHAGEIFSVVDQNRDSLRQWLPWVDRTHGPDDTRSFIEKSLNEFASGTGLALGIWCGGQFAGTVGCHPFDLANRRAEIGYWIARQWQGRGMVTAACRAVIDHLFQDLGMHRIEIRADPANDKSRRIPERLGFVQEGVAREAQYRNGSWHDLVVYSLLRDEWNARH